MDESALAELAVRAAGGDREATEDLVRSIHAPLFSLLYFLRVPSDEVDDVAQESVLQLYRSLPRYRPEQPFLPWMRRITGHVVTNHRRGRERERRRLSVFQEFLKRTGSSVTLESSWARNLHDRLRHCVERLQQRQRAIVNFRYVEGLPSPEIGKRLGMEPSAVRQILFRIQENLRRCLEPEPRAQRSDAHLQGLERDIRPPV